MSNCAVAWTKAISENRTKELLKLCMAHLQKGSHLQFAQGHADKTECPWKNVLWMDET